MQPDGQHPIESISFYVAVFAVASLATLARAASQGGSINWRNVVGKSFSSGFIAFGIVAFLVSSSGVDNDGHTHSHWYFLGVSALVGLLAKEQDAIVKTVISKALRIGRILSDEKEKGE